jgi:ankyrin repeat protein
MPEIIIYGEKVDCKKYWNPLFYSIYYGHKLIVEYLLENSNPRFLLTAPEGSGTGMPTLDCLCYTLTLSVFKKNKEILHYLVNEYSRGSDLIWNIEHLVFALRGCIVEGWLEGIEIIMAGKALKYLYQCLSFDLRLDFMVDRVAPLLDLADDYVRKSSLFSILAEHPFSC